MRMYRATSGIALIVAIAASAQDGAPPVRVDPEPVTTTDLSPVVARYAESDDPALRERAVEAIASLPDHVALVHLLDFLDDEEEVVRSRALAALRRYDERALAAEIMARLDEGAPESWYGWESPLPQLGPKLGGYCLEILQDDAQGEDVRGWAAYCLGRMRVNEAYEPLTDALWNGPAELAYACVEALYWLDDPRSQDDWLRLTNDNDPWVQWYVVSALSRVPSNRALNVLTGYATGQLTSPPEIQALALQGIAAWPPQVSVHRLIQVLKTNRMMEEQAIAALVPITGIDLGPYAPSLIEWYEREVGGFAPPEGEIAGDAAPPLVPANSLLQTVDFVPPPYKRGNP